MLDIGSPAPDFSLPDATGAVHTLANFRGTTVVLYFYPKDFTPGCTAEACAFRDAYTDFKDAGAEVIGVSGDRAEAHAQFAQRHGLPFLLLSDPRGRVAAMYGVKKTLGLLPGRVTFVIDGAGTIVHSFSSQFAAERHIPEALAVVRRLAG